MPIPPETVSLFNQFMFLFFLLVPLPRLDNVLNQPVTPFEQFK